MAKSKSSNEIITWLLVLLCLASPCLGLLMAERAFTTYMTLGLFAGSFLFPFGCMIFFTKAGEDE